MIIENSHTPLVSVLLASYNHERFVEAAILSILNQKNCDFELIVIDDGSSDNSPQIIEKLSKEYGFKFIHRENKGFIPTLLELVSLSRGKYFCTFASDDIMTENRLKIQSDFLEKNKSYVACFGQVQMIDSEGNKGRIDERYQRAIPEVSFEDLFLAKKILHGCGEMILKSAYLEVGGYNANFKTEDFYMMLALSYRFKKLAVIPDVVCYYRDNHGGNMHLNYELTYGEMFKILAQYDKHPLYKKALNYYKSGFFSELAYRNKKEALKRFFKLASFSKPFLRRLPKLFIPSCFLRY